MTGDQLIERFEKNLTPEDSFHHADHVRLAFEYLQRFSTLQALGKFSDTLKRFAFFHGKTGLYHETITCAYFFLIHERIAADETKTWEEFALRNPDLLVWKNGILNRYYIDATLASELARRVFVLPDIGL